MFVTTPPRLGEKIQFWQKCIVSLHSENDVDVFGSGTCRLGFHDGDEFILNFATAKVPIGTT